MDMHVYNAMELSLVNSSSLDPTAYALFLGDLYYYLVYS
jgi:hypothetical protein